MNNIKFLHHVRRVSFVSSFCSSHDKYPRLIQHLAKRSMSTSVSISQIMKEKEVFHDALPGIIDKLQANPKISLVPEIGPWLKMVLEYNLKGGKKSRGLITTYAYEMFEKPENLTEETLMQSRVLGWCLEMLHAYFLMMDDIMDGSSTRRGVPCWYRMPNVGLGAINDCILIHAAIMETLDTYFGKSPNFSDIVRLFNEALLVTSMGQHLDLRMPHHANQDYSLFTIDRYASIANHKTSWYTFRTPLALALTLVRDVDKKMLAQFFDIAEQIGKLFQIQDDYIDCYGDESVTGKAGTDIQEGKCSWLAVTALKVCNDSQRDLFTKFYASQEAEHVDIIKRLYEELRIPELYLQEESKLHDDIVQKIRALPSESAQKFFHKLLNQIYKRNH